MRRVWPVRAAVLGESMTAYYPHVRETALPTDLSPMEGRIQTATRTSRVRGAGRSAEILRSVPFLGAGRADATGEPVVCFRPGAKDLAEGGVVSATKFLRRAPTPIEIPRHSKGILAGCADAIGTISIDRGVPWHF